MHARKNAISPKESARAYRVENCERETNESVGCRSLRAGRPQSRQVKNRFHEKGRRCNKISDVLRRGIAVVIFFRLCQTTFFYVPLRCLSLSPSLFLSLSSAQLSITVKINTLARANNLPSCVKSSKRSIREPAPADLELLFHPPDHRFLLAISFFSLTRMRPSAPSLSYAYPSRSPSPATRFFLPGLSAY